MNCLSYLVNGSSHLASDVQSVRLFRAGSRLLGNLIFTRPDSGNIVPGVFTPVLAKHSKSFSLIDCISVVVDRMQRNFEPMREQVEAGREVS